MSVATTAAIVRIGARHTEELAERTRLAANAPPTPTSVPSATGHRLTENHPDDVGRRRASAMRRRFLPPLRDEAR